MREEVGLCLGLKLGLEEALIGTHRGVIRAKYSRRLDAGESWDRDVLHRLQGRLACPAPQVPGRPADSIPIHISDDKTQMDHEVDAHEPLREPCGEGEIPKIDTAPDTDMKRMDVREDLLENNTVTQMDAEGATQFDKGSSGTDIQMSADES